MVPGLSLPTLALVTKTLGHTARLRIVAMLGHNRLSVCQIASVLEVPPSTASGYLLELRRAGLVSEQREGRWVYYRLAADESVELIVRLALFLVSSDTQIVKDERIARAMNGASPEALCACAGEEAPIARPPEAGERQENRQSR